MLLRYLLLIGALFICSVHSQAQMTGVIVEVDTAFFEPTTFDEEGEPLFAELEGYVTYKLFAEFTNPTDQLSAIYSDDVVFNSLLLYIDAPCGCFNPELGDVLLGGNQNSMLFDIFPEVAYDTYWTLGFATGEQFFSTDFDVDSYSAVMCSEQIGNGAMFTVSPESAGDDLRIQFAQITTCGDFEFHACFQVFVEGQGTPPQLWCMDEQLGGPMYISGACSGINAPELEQSCQGEDNVGVAIDGNLPFVGAELWQLDGTDSVLIAAIDGNGPNGPFVFETTDSSLYYITTIDTNSCLDTTSVFQVSDFSTCIDSCGTPILDSPDLLFSASGTPYLQTCPDGTVFLDGSASLGTGAGPLNYHWEFAGELAEGDAPETELAVPSIPGVYWATLAVSDSNYCQFPSADSLLVLVSPFPELEILSSSPVCAGSAGYVEVVDVFGGFLDTTIISGPSISPSGFAAGFTYVSEMMVNTFEEGAVISSCDDIASIQVDMEHSYLGDLDIFIECPNGTQVLLQAQAGGGTFLGEPVDVEGDFSAGTCYAYGWTEDSTLGLMHEGNVTIMSYTDTQGNAAIGNILDEGLYAPYESLCALEGCPLNGTWQFGYTDLLGLDNGSACSWGIEFNAALLPELPNGAPSIGLNADSSYWSSWSAALDVLELSEDGNRLDFQTTTSGTFNATYTVTNLFGCSFDSTYAIEVVPSPDFDLSVPEMFSACQGSVVLENELAFNPDNDNEECSQASGLTTHCYDANAFDVFTYCPDEPGDGTMMDLSFITGEIQMFWDALYVYDGDSDAAPLIAALDGDLEGVTVQASSPSGCLTVVVVSDEWGSCADGTVEPLQWCVSCSGAEEVWTSCTSTLWQWQPAELFGAEANAQEPVIEAADFPVTTDVTAEVTFVSPGGATCSSVTAASVGPPPLNGEVIMPSCMDAGAGMVTIVLNEAPLGAIQVFVNGEYDQLASNGNAFEIGPLESGEYTVDGFDWDLNCLFSTVFSLDVSDINENADVICSVSVDEVLQKPTIAWTPNPDNSVELWELYRAEASAGGFTLIATLPNDGTYEYTDLEASPGEHAERYNLRALDPCGDFIDVQEEARSNFLSGSISLGATIALAWDDWGTPDAVYSIQRAVGLLGSFETIGEVWGVTGFTDLTPPLEEVLRYRIAATGESAACAESDSTFSNIIGALNPTLGTELNDELYATSMVQMGPGSRVFQFGFPSVEVAFDLCVRDVSGRVVHTLSFARGIRRETRTIELLATGLYVFDLTGSNGARTVKEFVVH